MLLLGMLDPHQPRIDDYEARFVVLYAGIGAEMLSCGSWLKESMEQRQI